jgi:L-alanine-DL-glutamate epimerase-like enolase superfamily enzyme
MTITSVSIRRLRMGLHRPYHLSYRTFEEFEPYLVQVRDEAGRSSFGDGHISPGSSTETREGGWAHLSELAAGAISMEAGEAKDMALARFTESPVAATALVTALECLQDSPLLDVRHAVRLPIHSPIGSLNSDAIPAEIEALLEQGYKTFKIKVGKDLDADLKRVAAIQQAADGRATLRIDANRAYDRDRGCRFATGIDAAGVELFEQPCPADDWDANAAVAQASAIPVMLDESICTLDDIDRAAGIEGVGFCKLKLKRFGGLERLAEGLERVRAGGMEPVLGDGLGSEICNWMEACVARATIRNAGEFNGYLKTRDRLFGDPLGFDNGALVMAAGYSPELDPGAVDRLTTELAEF